MEINEQKRSEIVKGLTYGLTLEQVAEIEQVSVADVQKIEQEVNKDG